MVSSPRTAHAPSDITLDDDPVDDGPAQDHPVEDAAAPTHIGDMSSPEITVTVVELSYAEGTSDKFYRVYSINESELTCQYGRTGTYGTFTPRKAAANAAAAVKAADKATAGKSVKGYQIIRSGELSFDHTPTDGDLDSAVGRMPAGVSTEVSTPQLREQSEVTTAANSGAVDATALPRVTAALDDKLGRRSSGGTATVVPMLAQVATKPEVEHMLARPSWVTQPKLDGDRVLVSVQDGQVSEINRSGQPKVRNVGEAHLAPFRALTAGRWAFDGEVVGLVFHVFDMPAGGHYVTEGTGFTRRQEALRVTLEALAVDSSAITKVATATGEDAKREMLQAAKSGRKEGVIFRQADAGYQPGRSEVLRKHKFVKEIDAYVIEVGKGGKENAVLAVRNEAGEEVVVGQVSTIGKGSIRVGDVVETQYLYITSLAKPVLFQPTIMRVRTDKLAAECSTGQLVDSVTDKSVEQ